MDKKYKSKAIVFDISQVEISLISQKKYHYLRTIFMILIHPIEIKESRKFTSKITLFYFLEVEPKKIKFVE